MTPPPKNKGGRPFSTGRTHPLVAAALKESEAENAVLQNANAELLKQVRWLESRLAVYEEEEAVANRAIT